MLWRIRKKESSGTSIKPNLGRKSRSDEHAREGRRGSTCSSPHCVAGSSVSCSEGHGKRYCTFRTKNFWRPPMNITKLKLESPTLHLRMPLRQNNSPIQDSPHRGRTQTDANCTRRDCELSIYDHEHDTEECGHEGASCEATTSAKRRFDEICAELANARSNITQWYAETSNENDNKTYDSTGTTTDSEYDNIP